MNTETLGSLVLVLASFSLVALGGGNSVLPGIEAHFVAGGLISAERFAELFAVARVAPGPGSMLVTLIGWELAGWTGAVLATAAFFGPSSLLFFCFVSVMRRHRERFAVKVLEAALAPVGVGLLLAGSIAILRVADTGLMSWALAGSICLLALRVPRLHPFLFLLGGGLVYLAWHLAGGG